MVKRRKRFGRSPIRDNASSSQNDSPTKAGRTAQVFGGRLDIYTHDYRKGLHVRSRGVR